MKRSCLHIQAAGLYPTNSAEVNSFILGDCKANFLIVDDERTIIAIDSYLNKLPHLKKIIKWGDPISGTYDFEVLHWDEVMALGMDDIDDEPVLSRQKSMAINQCCVLVYTSGTTGNPKG